MSKEKHIEWKRPLCCILLVVATIFSILTLAMSHSQVKVVSTSFEQRRLFFLYEVCVSGPDGSGGSCESWDEIDCHTLEDDKIQPYACSLQHMTLGAIVMFSIVLALTILATVVLALPLITPKKSSQDRTIKLSKATKYAYHGLTLLSALLSTVASLWSVAVFSLEECTTLKESYQATSCSQSSGVGAFVSVMCSVVLLVVCIISLTDRHLCIHSRFKGISRKLQLSTSSPGSPLSPTLSSVYSAATTPHSAASTPSGLGPQRTYSTRALLSRVDSGAVDEFSASASPRADVSYDMLGKPGLSELRLAPPQTRQSRLGGTLIMEDVSSP